MTVPRRPVMPVPDLLFGFFLLFALIAILRLMLPGMRKRGYAAKTTRGLGSYEASDGNRLAGGIVATQAINAWLDLGPAGTAAGALTGGVIGAIAAVLPRKPLGIVFQLIGAAGIIGVLIGFTTDSICSGLALENRIVILVVLAFSALIGAVLAGVWGRLRAAPLLALFGTLEILIFLGQPFGVTLFQEGAIAALAPIALAGLLGFFGGLMPGVVIGLAAVGIGFATVAVSAGYGTMCTAGRDFDPLVILVSFVVVFAVARRSAPGAR